MNLRRAFLGLFAITVLCSLVPAQGKQASIDAVTKWSEAIVSKTADSSFRAIGVAAERTSTGINVNLALACGAETTNIGPLTFKVQAVSVNGSQVARLGKSAQIASPALERDAGDTNPIIATPMLTIQDQPGANAIEVTVTGLSGPANAASIMIIPLGDGVKTAVLGTRN